MTLSVRKTIEDQLLIEFIKNKTYEAPDRMYRADMDALSRNTNLSKHIIMEYLEHDLMEWSVRINEGSITNLFNVVEDMELDFVMGEYRLYLSKAICERVEEIADTIRAKDISEESAIKHKEEMESKLRSIGTSEFLVADMTNCMKTHHHFESDTTKKN